MRVALQPADTKLQAWFAKAVVVISVLRGLSLRVRIYVIPLERITVGAMGSLRKADGNDVGCITYGSIAVRRMRKFLGVFNAPSHQNTRFMFWSNWS